MKFNSKFTKDGRILLESNGVLLNFDKSICTDSPELITSDEYYERFVKCKTPAAAQWSCEAANLERANDRHIHYGY